MCASLATLVALLGAPAPAAPPAPDAPAPPANTARTVTLSEVLAAAGQAPTHRAAQAHAKSAAAAVDAAGAFPPTTVSVGTSRLQARLVAGLQVPLPVFGRPWLAEDVASEESSAARATAQGQDLDLRHDVAVAWYALAHDQARAEVAVTQAARAAQLAQVAHRRFDAGDAPRRDTVQADAAAARAEVEAGSLRAQVDATSADLAALLGWDPVAPLRAGGGLPTRFPAAPALESLTARLDAHPAVAAADARVAAAEARVTAAARDWWPALSLGAEMEAFDPSLQGPDIRVTLNVDLPIFGGKAGATNAAAAEQTAAAAERDSLVSRALGNLVASYRRYQAAQQRALAVAQKVVPAAEDAAHLAEVAYQQGEGDLVSVLDAQRALSDVQREWLDARLSAAMALADLQRAAGGET